VTFLSHKKLGYIYAMSSGLCYGFIGYFGKILINAELSVHNMLFWRFFVATIIMLIIIVPKYQLIFQSYIESLKIFICGLILYSSSAILYFISSEYIGTGLAMVIFFIYPAIVMLFNVIFDKQKLDNIYYLSLLFLIIGIICLVDITQFKFDFIGILISLIASFSYALYIFLSKKIKISTNISTFMVSSGSMLTCLFVAIFDDSFYVPKDLNIWINIIYMASICTIIPILLFFYSIKYITSEQASLLSVLEPVFVVILGILFLNEKITIMQIAGIIITLSGAIITIIPKKSIKNK